MAPSPAPAIKTIPSFAWTARADGYIYWYNDAWFDYTGTTPEQMEGWGWQSVHHPKILPAVLTEWHGSIDRGEPFEMIFPIRGKDGLYRPFLTRVGPTRNCAGAVTGWVGVNIDMTVFSRDGRLREELRKIEPLLGAKALDPSCATLPQQQAFP